MVDSEIIVEARSLKKHYKDFWGRTKAVGVDGIDFCIHRGEVAGLLGPNGSGKTTTIKLILGLLRPSSGTIKIFDENPENSQIKKRIGYLPEDTYLYEYLSAEETLDYFGSLFRLPSKERKKRTKQLLEMVGLSHAAKRRLGEFSKGMARRIGLAQSLINDPDLVILDEPTSGLDPIGCRDVKHLIRLLSSRSKTIIISSHLLADLEGVCHKIFVFYNGKIQAQGPLKKLLTVPDEIRVTLPSVNSQVIDEIVERCKTSDPPINVSVDQPTIRLEEFFLRTVNEATQTRAYNAEFNSEYRLADHLVNDIGNRKSSEQLLKKWKLERIETQNKVKQRSQYNVATPAPDLEHLRSLTKDGSKKESKN